MQAVEIFIGDVDLVVFPGLYIPHCSFPGQSILKLLIDLLHHQKLQLGNCLVILIAGNKRQLTNGPIRQKTLLGSPFWNFQFQVIQSRRTSHSHPQQQAEQACRQTL